MTYYLRRMGKEDIAQVTEIDREAFPTQWPPPNFQSELRNRMAYFTVVCDGEKPLDPPEEKGARGKNQRGFASAFRRLFSRRPSDNEASATSECVIGFVGSWIMADEAHITTIAVREAYRRKGIGEMLLISAIELANEQKANIVTLEVRVSNTGAQSLYTKYGFTQVGLRRAYYTDNREDAILMSTDKINSPLFQNRFQQLKETLSRRRAAEAKAIPSN